MDGQSAFRGKGEGQYARNKPEWLVQKRAARDALQAQRREEKYDRQEGQVREMAQRFGVEVDLPRPTDWSQSREVLATHLNRARAQVKATPQFQEFAAQRDAAGERGVGWRSTQG
jgi:hypothetical protein